MSLLPCTYGQGTASSSLQALIQRLRAAIYLFCIYLFSYVYICHVHMCVYTHACTYVYSMAAARTQRGQPAVVQNACCSETSRRCRSNVLLQAAAGLRAAGAMSHSAEGLRPAVGGLRCSPSVSAKTCRLGMWIQSLVKSLEQYLQSDRS